MNVNFFCQWENGFPACCTKHGEIWASFKFSCQYRHLYYHSWITSILIHISLQYIELFYNAPELYTECMNVPYQMYFLYCNSFPIWSQGLLCRFWYFPPSIHQNHSMSQEMNTRQVSSKCLGVFTISVSRAGIPSTVLFSKDTLG